MNRAFVLNTGARSAGDKPFQRLVTIDCPTELLGSCDTPNGPRFLVRNNDEVSIQSLPVPEHVGENNYARARKMDFVWKSKKFTMSSRTTFTVYKAKYKGCVKLQIYVDGCCVFNTPLTTCAPCRLPIALTGHTFEFMFRGDGEVIDFEIASSMEELARSG